MRKDEAKSILLKTIPCPYQDNEKICHHLQEGGGDCESCYEEALDTILDLVEKQQKEIKDWFEIADNILRATNDYGNITIGDIPRYIEKLQKEIEELHKEINRRIKLKIENEKCVDRDFIYKGKIREKIKNIEDIYKKEMKPYQTEYGLNVSLLSKKEKEELINKRNGLLTQKITLEDLLEGN